jgi:hypothetical protein
MGSVTVLNYMPPHPIVDAVGCLGRGGDGRHDPGLEASRKNASSNSLLPQRTLPRIIYNNAAARPIGF